jgi:hypothetical protein
VRPVAWRDARMGVLVWISEPIQQLSRMHDPPIDAQSLDFVQAKKPPISQQQGFDSVQATLITGLVDIKLDETEGRNTTSIRFRALFFHWLKSNSPAIPNWAANKSTDIAARTNRLIELALRW